MPEVTQHKPMTPSWIDIGTDVEGAKRFYTALFGWETQEAGPVEETGGYGFFTKGGKLVAGFGPQQSPGPPYWSTYIDVPDAGQIAKNVEAAGGQVVVAPMEVMDAGSMAVFVDAQGAFICAWQPASHKGAQLVREPGSFTWCELNTRDVAGSKEFYASVFGWRATTQGEGGPMPYTEFKLDGDESIAGMMAIPAGVPAEVPPHWLVYIQVADVDAGAAKAKELGGSVVVPPTDYPGGRFAVLTDPQGAHFGVMQPSTS
jgi:predicted enzyme related to lactoylglutathione lyase